MALLRNGHKVLTGCPDPDANEFADRCTVLISKIERGQYRTHCEVSTELRSIIDEMDGMMKS
jgi:hypothetical protein